jgi:hypothetical protein
MEVGCVWQQCATCFADVTTQIGMVVVSVQAKQVLCEAQLRCQACCCVLHQCCGFCTAHPDPIPVVAAWSALSMCREPGAAPAGQAICEGNWLRARRCEARHPPPSGCAAQVHDKATSFSRSGKRAASKVVEELLEKQAGKAAVLTTCQGLCTSAAAAGQGTAAPLEACRIAALSRRLFVELRPLLEVGAAPGALQHTCHPAACRSRLSRRAGLQELPAREMLYPGCRGR